MSGTRYLQVTSTKRCKIVASAHNLHIDQSQLLGNEISMVMLGMVSAADFASNVAQEVRVSKEEAERIAADVNTKIFAPIRESLKKMYEQGEEVPASTTSQKSVVMPSSLATSKPAMPQTPAVAVPPKSASPTPVPVPAAPIAIPAVPCSAHSLRHAETLPHQRPIFIPPSEFYRKNSPGASSYASASRAGFDRARKAGGSAKTRHIQG